MNLVVHDLSAWAETVHTAVRRLEETLGAKPHDRDAYAVFGDVEDRGGLDQGSNGQGAFQDRLPCRQHLQNNGFGAHVHHANITRK